MDEIENITDYEKFLCLRMFESLYLPETAFTRIILQRVPGGYNWREWSKDENGNTDGFIVRFIPFEEFFDTVVALLDGDRLCKKGHHYFYVSSLLMNDKYSYKGILTPRITDYVSRSNFEKYWTVIATYNSKDDNIIFNNEVKNGK